LAFVLAAELPVLPQQMESAAAGLQKRPEQHQPGSIDQPGLTNATVVLWGEWMRSRDGSPEPRGMG
jgi:hypothetical protein